MLERLNLMVRTFSQGLDPPVIQVPHIANDLVPGRGPLSEEAKADALDLSADHKLSRDFGHLRMTQSNTETRVAQRDGGQPSKPFCCQSVIIESGLMGMSQFEFRVQPSGFRLAIVGKLELQL
jgi:hypothetical protein